jgi:hypothetical protein
LAEELEAARRRAEITTDVDRATRLAAIFSGMNSGEVAMPANMLEYEPLRALPRPRDEV